MNITKEQAHWDWWNKAKRTGHHESDGMFLEVRAAVLEEIRRYGPAAGRLIEIACGTGWLSDMVQEKYAYLGLDIGPESIEIAKSSHPHSEFICEDFLNWNPTDSFDLAVFIDAIAVFRDQDAAIAKIRSFLARGSYLFMTTVNPIVYSRLSWIGAPAEGQARKWLSRSELLSLLERNSFEVVRTYTVVPSGDKGFLRILNSWKLNRLFGMVIPKRWLKRLKEIVGLGAVRIAVARKI
ncbi:MAG: class I SAM-dependent methyltransferase [Nibricoccus sp.]